jgi:hypothetical protein
MQTPVASPGRRRRGGKIGLACAQGGVMFLSDEIGIHYRTQHNLGFTFPAPVG